MTTVTCPVRQAACLMGCEFIESLLFRAALEAGFGTGSEQRAREMYQTYQRGGFMGLPTYAQKFIIAVNKGQVTLKGGGLSEPRKAS